MCVDFLIFFVSKIRKIVYTQRQVFFQDKNIGLISQEYHNKRQKRGFYDNVQSTRQQTPKTELDGRKIMLSVWCVHFEFLNYNQIINADLYTHYLQYVHENLQREHPTLVKRRNIVLLMVNKSHHPAKISQEKILDLGWSVLPNPPYLPNLKPNDLYLFHSQQNALCD